MATFNDQQGSSEEPENPEQIPLLQKIAAASREQVETEKSAAETASDVASSLANHCSTEVLGHLRDELTAILDDLDPASSASD